VAIRPEVGRQLGDHMHIKETENGVIIQVKVTPNSSRNAIIQGSNDLLTVKLTSPPVEGKANKGLLKFLAKKMQVAPSAITILKGHSSREKTLLIVGVDLATAKDRLETNRPEQ
jgi:uncharacterized protein